MSSSPLGALLPYRYLATVWRPTSAAIGSFLLITVLSLAGMIFVSKAICTVMLANALDMNLSTGVRDGGLAGGSVSTSAGQVATSANSSDASGGGDVPQSRACREDRCTRRRLRADTHRGS